MFEEALKLLDPAKASDVEVESMLSAVGFSDCAAAHKRLLGISGNDELRSALGECLPMLLSALSEAATPDVR